MEDANPEVVRYLNRLSDLLFILSRGANAGRRAAVGAGAVSRVGTGHPPRPPIAMRPLDEGAMAAARARQAQLVKPPGSLGRLEDLAVWLAGVTGSERPALQARVVVAAADHGVAAQGVSAYPQAVTAQMLATFASGRGAVSTLAGAVDADLVLVDAGVAGGSAGIDCLRVGLGPSRDLSVQAALEVAEVALAVDAGRDLAARAAADGVTVLAGGEMGIANTTPATCLAAVLTGRDVAQLVGPGTGLDDAGVARKRAVCERALALHADAARGPLARAAPTGRRRDRGPLRAGPGGRRARPRLRVRRPHRHRGGGRRGRASSQACARACWPATARPSRLTASCWTTSASTRCSTSACAWARAAARRPPWPCCASPWRRMTGWPPSPRPA